MAFSNFGNGLTDKSSSTVTPVVFVVIFPPFEEGIIRNLIKIPWMVLKNVHGCTIILYALCELFSTLLRKYIEKKGEKDEKT
jgi:hypothetical protein